MVGVHQFSMPSCARVEVGLGILANQVDDGVAFANPGLGLSEGSRDALHLRPLTLDHLEFWRGVLGRGLCTFRWALRRLRCVPLDWTDHPRCLLNHMGQL